MGDKTDQMIEFNPRDLYFKNPFGAITRYTDL
jgi:hypothetical protein